jgi:hypothetical protein
MKPQDILKLAVRLLGLIFLYQGLQALPTALVQFCAAIRIMNSGMILTSVMFAGWPLLVAYWLLRGASLIMRTAYPDSEGRSEPETRIGGALGKQTDA